MSIIATIPAFILNNRFALNFFLKFGLDNFLHLSHSEQYAKWKEWAYLAYYARDSSRPEHVFNERWAFFAHEASQDFHILQHALNFLGSEYLTGDYGLLNVKSCAQYERWQNLQSRLSLVPVIETTAEQWNIPMGKTRNVLYPYNPRLEDYICRNGLNEMHMHINLCTSAEEIWLHCLYHLPEYYNSLKRKSAAQQRFFESMMKQVDSNLNIDEHVNRMRLARALRHYALFLLNGHVPLEVDISHLLQHYRYPDLKFTRLLDPSFVVSMPQQLSQLLGNEKLMWRKYQNSTARQEYHELVSHVLHVYLLLQNEFIRLSRLRDNQVGLQEFCKTTAYPRDLGTTKVYQQAFNTSRQHTSPNARNVIEVRFSPRGILPDKIRSIINAALQEAGGEDCHIASGAFITNHIKKLFLPYRLVLVAHLIKRAKESKSGRMGAIYNKARTDYIQEIAALVSWHQRGLHQLIPIGLDVAGSEVLLPVDVFVPAYKAFSLYNKKGRTFHCGEDFLHLISGIRAVYDVIALLNFIPGNRVGHAVALGIHPEIWLESMPAKIVLTRREWMLDLIFSRKMFLRSEKLHTEVLSDVEEELAGHATYIFQQNVDSHTLSSMYDARTFIPEILHDFLHKHKENNSTDNPPILDATGLPVNVQLQEYALIGDFLNKHGILPLSLIEQWNFDEQIQKRLDERIEIAADFLKTLPLITLQQAVQRYVKEKGIVIEALPVSNYRIGQYTSIKKLHILRWLQVPGCAIAGDTEMDICIGSDDPGIFASDIKADYYHLFCCMKELGLSDVDAVEKLATLNDTGRIYAFNHVNTATSESPCSI